MPCSYIVRRYILYIIICNFYLNVNYYSGNPRYSLILEIALFSYSGNLCYSGITGTFVKYEGLFRVHFLKVRKYLPGADVTPLKAFKFSSGQNRTHKIV